MGTRGDAMTVRTAAETTSGTGRIAGAISAAAAATMVGVGEGVGMAVGVGRRVMGTVGGGGETVPKGARKGGVEGRPLPLLPREAMPRPLASLRRPHNHHHRRRAAHLRRVEDKG
jgi:hypothetical protein